MLGTTFQIESDHKPLIPLLSTKQLDSLPPCTLRFRLSSVTLYNMYLESYYTQPTHCHKHCCRSLLRTLIIQLSLTTLSSLLPALLCLCLPVVDVYRFMLQLRTMIPCVLKLKSIVERDSQKGNRRSFQISDHTGR